MTCREVRAHTYVTTRRAGVNGFEQIFGCAECKTERRFGLLATYDAGVMPLMPRGVA